MGKDNGRFQGLFLFIRPRCQCKPCCSFFAFYKQLRNSWKSGIVFQEEIWAEIWGFRNRITLFAFLIFFLFN